MTIIPKKTKFRVSFRNKLDTKKIKTHDLRQANYRYMKHQKCLTTYFHAEDNSIIKTLTSSSENKQNIQSDNKLSFNHTNLLFGTYGIFFETHQILTAKYIETFQLEMAKMFKKKARIWIRIVCDTPVTARPLETRMGKGKGAIDHWTVKVRPGQILFEFSGPPSIREKIELLIAKLNKKSKSSLKVVLKEK